jgi:hypothetical protein
VITHHEKLEEKIKRLDPSIAIIAFTPRHKNYSMAETS